MLQARDPRRRSARGPGAARNRFAGRDRETERFRHLVGGDPAQPRPLLMFYGVGGAGKSWLLRHLQQECDALEIPWAAVDLDHAAGGAQALQLLAEQLQNRHGLDFPGFKRVVAVLAARQTGALPEHEASGGAETASQAADLALDLLSLAPIVGQLAALVKVSKSSLQLAWDRAMQHPGFRRSVTRLGGEQELLELLDWDAEELREELLDRFALEIVEGLPRPKDGAARGVLFFDTHEALWRDGKGGAFADDAWLRELRRCLHEQQVLMVVAGRDPLQWGEGWDEVDTVGRRVWLEQHALGGLSRSDALEYLRRADTGEPSPMPAHLAEAILEVTNESPPGAEPAHHCFLLYLCAETVANLKQVRGNYPSPDEFQRIPPGETAADPLLQRFLHSLHSDAMVGWLTELSLSPRFDQEYALALDSARHHHNGRPGWKRLTQLSLFSPGPRAPGFVEPNRLLRAALQPAVPADEAAAIHEWAYAYWMQRAEATWKEHGYYSVEQPSWQTLIDLGMYHLCRSTALPPRRAALTFVELVLDVFWWWGECLPFQFWRRLLDTAAEAVASSGSAAERWTELLEAIDRLRRFDAAWPKGWLKELTSGEREAARWGSDAVAQWSWEESRKQMERLLAALGLAETAAQIGCRGTAAKLDPVEAHAAAMIGYYLASAGMYRAEEVAEGDPGRAQTLREEAERTFRRVEGWFNHMEPDALHRSWVQVLLGELYLSWGRGADAEALVDKALSGVEPRLAESGCAMECAAMAHWVLSELALRRDAAGAAGCHMQQALALARGFWAADSEPGEPDEYAETCYLDLKHHAERQAARLFEADSSVAQAYAVGLGCAGAPTDGERLSALLSRIAAAWPELPHAPDEADLRRAALNPEGGAPPQEAPGSRPRSS